MSEHVMVLAKMVDEGGACGKGVYLTRKQREALIVAITLMKSPVQASEARGLDVTAIDSEHGIRGSAECGEQRRGGDDI